MRVRPRVYRGGSIVLLAALATALTSCQGGHPERRVLPPGNERLTGLWDAVFFDEQAPRSTYVAPSRGTLSFLEPADRAPALKRNLPELSPAVPVAYAVWDVDFAARGFDLRPSDRVPTAIAALDTPPAPPQVRVVLEPDASTRMLLVGSWRGDSVVGRWQIVADGRSGFTASGRFALAPHGAHARSVPPRTP